jgi:hypothetical protein
MSFVTSISSCSVYIAASFEWLFTEACMGGWPRGGVEIESTTISERPDAKPIVDQGCTQVFLTFGLSVIFRAQSMSLGSRPTARA